jgi:hypothetical protein
MARTVCSSAPLRGAAPFLRICRRGKGPVCHVSAVSRGHSPGNYFPQLGPQLFVITGEAITSRFRSSPLSFLMGLWSSQRNDNRSLLVELVNTTNSVKGSTKKGIIVRARKAAKARTNAGDRPSARHRDVCFSLIFPRLRALMQHRRNPPFFAN